MSPKTNGILVFVDGTTWVAESFDISKETINTYKLLKRKANKNHAEAEMRLVPWPSRLSPLQVRKAARLGDLLVDCGESQPAWLLVAACCRRCVSRSWPTCHRITALQKAGSRKSLRYFAELVGLANCIIEYHTEDDMVLFFAPGVLFWSFAIPWYPQNRCLEINLAAGAHLILSMVQPWQLGRKVLGCGWWKWEKL